MRRNIGNAEINGDMVQKRGFGQVDTLCTEIICRAENKPVTARCKIAAVKNSRARAPVMVGDVAADFRETAVIFRAV